MDFLTVFEAIEELLEFIQFGPGLIFRITRSVE